MLRKVWLLQSALTLGAAAIGESTCSDEDGVAALQLKRATIPCNGSSNGKDPISCPTDLSNPYCGTGDKWQDMSCTPYKYLTKTYNKAKPNTCQNMPFDVLTYGGDRARAWAYFNDQGKADTNYWVFHGCDGAGLQPDCLGDVKYVERFYGYKGQNKQGCQEHPGSNMRNYCSFVHPGTFSTYDNYEAGWWNNGAAGTPQGVQDYMVGSAASGGWGKYVGAGVAGCDTTISHCFEKSKIVYDYPNPYLSKDGTNWNNCPQHVLTMVMFPFVCTGSDNTQNDNFAYPSWGGGSNSVKCYSDNEPGTDAGGGRGWPPSVTIYYMVLYKNDAATSCDDIEGWAINVRKFYLKGDGSGVEEDGSSPEWTLQPCHEGDECPW